MSKLQFIELLQETKREGISELINYLESTDFFKAPASTHFHGAHEGGLLDHSINVYNRLKTNPKLSNFDLRSESTSIKIIALLHDICKVGCYESYDRNVKEGGQWVKKKAYKWNDERVTYGHGEESVLVISRFIKLTVEEQFSIRYHMGAFVEQDKRALGNVYAKYPIAFYLHVADMEATTFDEI